MAVKCYDTRGRYIKLVNDNVLQKYFQLVNSKDMVLVQPHILLTPLNILVNIIKIHINSKAIVDDSKELLYTIITMNARN
ncbi:hypothetical protein [Trichoplusia ni ascovirus 2c]|uniref:hypothetical protein n=1 Tax=Trichoplusia ni ascovirus 2c TaxID=328615 RepID=UPI0000E44205|nr:hypothetical protein TNAV2c_gp045 [Trichoplusia ni ascovirus 2c]ABF70562.1 hypothetical protein [Trichoplusia ni ascovirus 2c]